VSARRRNWRALAGQRVNGQTNIVTYHYDNGRTGQNTNETILTPGNLNPASFGWLFRLSVDGLVWAQPLYVSNVIIPGLGTHNVLYVVTSHDSVYVLPKLEMEKTFFR